MTEFPSYKTDMSPDDVHDWAQKAQLRIDQLEDALRTARDNFEDVNFSSNNEGAVRTAADRGIDEITKVIGLRERLPNARTQAAMIEPSTQNAPRIQIRNA
ncbi:hypothetical protein [Ruegeria atlantica]|uniref:hypothetical protein n=1 Tax=Ruegeria atlantica TaxID=81569 RepID=UPI0024942220|nr:hypothetical protein [Ruegeria atlantica]